MIAILFFAGLYFGHMYSSGFKAVDNKLAGCGIGKIYTSSARVLVIFSALMIFGVTGDLIFRGILSRAGAVTSSYKTDRILYMIPVCLLISLFHDLVYTLAGDSHKARMILLVTGILMLVAGGFFVPVSFLPGWCRGFMNILPLAVCQRYLLEGYTYSMTAGACAGIVIYILILAAGRVFVRCEAH